MMMPAMMKEARNCSSPLALDQSGEVGMGLGPQRMYLLANQRPASHAVAWRRNLQGIVLHVADQLVYRVAERTRKHSSRGNDQHGREQHHHRRRPALIAAHSAGKPLVQRVERDG